MYSLIDYLQNKKKHFIRSSTLMSIYSNRFSSSMDERLIVLEGFYSDKKGKL
ncbi:hypothetical protein SAMN05444481_107159 [Flavobacterium frigidimaris]|nr:hypothetical protein SAMN05444481_107159 [Flavobacterium frigidimaris]